jgi:hypothetical protein
VDIAAGWGHSVALKKDGDVVAWGINDHGQQSTIPAELGGVPTAIFAGGDTTYALLNGPLGPTAIGWGYDAFGQTRVPWEFISTPTQAALPLRSLAAGYDHVIALRDTGLPDGWGKNDQGQATISPAYRGLAQVAAGGDHSLGLTHSGRIFAWGDRTYGLNAIPAGLGPVKSIASGRYHNVALLADGTVRAWGSDARGQCSQVQRIAASAIAAGNEHTAIKTSDWDIMTTQPSGRLTSTRVAGGCTKLLAGGFHTLALRRSLEFSRSGISLMPMDLRLSHSGPGELRLLDASCDSPHFTVISTEGATRATLPSTVSIHPVPSDFGGTLKGTVTLTTNHPQPEQQQFLIPVSTQSAGLVSQPVSSRSHFRHSALRMDAQTGTLVQTVTFTHGESQPLGRQASTFLPLPDGFVLQVSALPAGVTLLGSSPGTEPGSLRVRFTRPMVLPGETAVLNLVYFDPSRRLSLRPIVRLMLPTEDDLLPLPLITGPLATIKSATPTANGNLIVAQALPGAIYVVQYARSPSGPWTSATHRLSTRSRVLYWVDRGQPETETFPLGLAPNTPQGRYYRVVQIQEG